MNDRPSILPAAVLRGGGFHGAGAGEASLVNGNLGMDDPAGVDLRGANLDGSDREGPRTGGKVSTPAVGMGD